MSRYALLAGSAVWHVMNIPCVLYRIICAAALFCCLLAPPSSAQEGTSNYEIIALGDTNDTGATPFGGLVLGPDGNYYGTAFDGGVFGRGTVFKLTTDGLLSALVSFPVTQGRPSEGLIVGSDGNLYGVTEGVGQATVFRATLSGQLTTLATFPHDSGTSVRPQKLVEAPDGNLYGTTESGGTQKKGSAFRLTKQGQLTTLVSFDGTNGARPQAGLIVGSDGNLYGTTLAGGVGDRGTVFRMTTAGALTTVAMFGNHASARMPVTELTQGADGDLYGVTRGFGGPPVVFKVSLSGTLTVVASLTTSAGTNPSPLTVGADGNFYGTSGPQFYRVTPAGELAVLRQFNAQFGGRSPDGPLFRLPDGQFLGTTRTGGKTNVNDFGTVQRLTSNGDEATVATFPKVFRGGFNNELAEGPDGQLYGTAGDDLFGDDPFTLVDTVAFKVTLSGDASPLGRLPMFQDLSDGLSSRLIPAANGELIGAISEGGFHDFEQYPDSEAAGFLYRISAAGQISTVYRFFDPGTPGNTPRGALTPGPNGELYGTTQRGENGGTFFKLDAEGSLTTIASFASDLFCAYGDLIFTDGAFYGRTVCGGDNDNGVFFRVTPAGQITIIASLPATDLAYNSRLILGADGNFYGAFASGGANDMGSVFRLTKDGVLSTLATMDANTGRPRGVMQASDGNFYGAGTAAIFRITPAGELSIVARFSEENGTVPLANLMQASDGNLYGTTASGGPTGRGVVYRVKLSVPPKELRNISTRLRVLTGENVLIGGFIVTGSQPKKVIVRALGPSLQKTGITGALANPALELRKEGGVLVASNDDWKTTQQPEIQASGVPPENDLESAIVATLQPGDYTATVSGANSTTGVGLVEVYDLDAAADSRLANISTRGFVATGENVMIAGLIASEGSSSAKAIVRAIGPSLQQDGVANALTDPTLELRDGNGALILANDNWKDDPAQAAEIQASGVPPRNDKEAAIALPLPTGATTAIVRGKSETTGVGLVEVYNIQ